MRGILRKTGYILTLMAITAGAAFAAPARIHTYQGSPAGFLVNSYVVETPNAVVVIDTQFTISEAKKLRELIAKTGKPIKGVIITHPHPDHYNGIATIVEGVEIPVYATQQTLEGIKATEAAKRTQWKPIYKEDYPDGTFLPNKIVHSGENLKIDGVSFVIEDLGAGESADEAIVYLPKEKALFTGDLVYNEVHPWLAEGRSSVWLAQLNTVSKRYSSAKTLYPGHGKSGDLSLLEKQSKYINEFRKLIADQLLVGPLTETSKNSIKVEMSKLYPGFPLDILLGWNIDAVAAELNQK